MTVPSIKPSLAGVLGDEGNIDLVQNGRQSTTCTLNHSVFQFWVKVRAIGNVYFTLS